MTKTDTNNPEQQARNDLPPLGGVAYRKKRIWFLAVILLQYCLLVCLILPRLYTAQTGKVVSFRTSPVDPWDMFRGQYVTLNFDEISALNIDRNFEVGKTVYVLLQNQGKTWKAKAAFSQKPQAGNDELVLKGKVESEYPHHRFHLKYGIEKYFVEEGKGKKYEGAKHLWAQVAIDSFGNAIVKNVRIE